MKLSKSLAAFRQGVFFLSFFAAVFGGSRGFAADQISPQLIENFVQRLCPQNNLSKGGGLESRFGISEFRDGKWNCNDRAEVAKRIAARHGYLALYSIEPTPDPRVRHRYLKLLDPGGNAHEILRRKK